MKQSEIHTEKDFGKRSGSSSHYRINCEGIKVQLMATVKGNKPSEQTEHLMCQIGYRHAFITAYLKGNGYVKLFSLRNFIEWQHNGRPMRSIDITQDEYDNDIAFERIVERNFLSLSTH